ncbi:hypothetical protein D3OALGB2SA_4617 [Olavius algarvensis associated proteobacterium Delta 3]|nr:hypothetical protein D3OALGB2SA_4617 [Olavius algarvensis associated proteobacterium Delta 3]
MVKFIDLEHLVSEKTADDRPARPTSTPEGPGTPFRQMEADLDLNTPDLTVAVDDQNDLYSEGLLYVTQVFAAIQKRKKFTLDSGFRIVRQIVQSQTAQRALFISAIHQDDTRAYLTQKSLNVSLFAIQAGETLGFGPEQQLEIGMAGLLHEIGMALIPETLLFKPGPLTGQEYKVVQQHSEFGYQILKSYSDQYPYLAEVALQVHERIDGSGYPQGLRGDEIHDYAQIIGLVDIYEALCHSRPHRDGFPHFYAIKEIIRTCKGSFQRKHLKALLNAVSIFPLSTLVRLNSNAIGRVIQTFPDRPMRPRLRIEYDSQGRKVLTERVVHLPDNPLLYIVDSVSEDDIRTLGKETVEVVRSQPSLPEPYAEMASEEPTEDFEDTPARSETPEFSTPAMAPQKRSKWFKRTLGLGILILVLAGALWQWYQSGEPAPPAGKVSKPVFQKAPPRVSSVPIREAVPKQQPAVLPTEKKAPPPVAGKDIPKAGQPRSAPPVPAMIKAAATRDPSGTSKESSAIHTPIPAGTATDTGSARAGYPYSVLLASFRSLASAENALSDYRRNGFPVYRVTVRLGEDGVWHRLFAGYFKRVEDAEEFVVAQQLGDALVKRTRFAAGLGESPSVAALTKKVQSLKQKGFSPYIIEDEAQRYHLMVGAFYTEEGAVQQVAELAKNGFPGQVVER